MTPETLQTLTAALDADIPALLWSPPGCGKSAAITALAQAQGAHLETLIGSQIDERDAGGVLMPLPSGEVINVPVPYAKRLRSALDAGRAAWLFLDELGSAPKLVQASLLRVVQERCVGDVDLRGCRVVAAANPPELAASAWDLSAATANRWLHLDWPVEYAYWCAGMLGGWGAPSSAALATGRARIAAFIARRPGLLLAVPTDPVQQGRAWPSPRSWDHASRVLASLSGCSKAAGTVGTAVTGLVGESAATEFLTWLVEADLPDPEQVLEDPLRYPLPERGDRLLATLDGVVAAAVRPLKNAAARRERWFAAVRVIGRVPKDVGLISAGVLGKHNPLAKSAHAMPDDVARVWVELHARGLALIKGGGN